MRKISLILAMIFIVCITFSCDKSNSKSIQRYGWDVKNFLEFMDGDFVLYGDIESVAFTIYEINNKFGNECVKDTSGIIVYSFNSNGDVANKVGYNSYGDIWLINTYTYDEKGRCFEEFYSDKELKESYNKYDKYEYFKYMIGDYEYRNKIIYDDEGNVIELFKYNHNNELVSHTSNLKDVNGNIVESVTHEIDECINQNPSYYINPNIREYQYVKYEIERRIKYLYDTNGKCTEEYCQVLTNKNNKTESKTNERKSYEYSGYNNYIYCIYIDTDCTGTTKELTHESKLVYLYDDNDRVIEIMSDGAEILNFKYDNKGNLIEKSSQNEIYLYQYDDNERCVVKTFKTEDKKLNLYDEEKTTIKYDDKGNMIEVCNYGKDRNLYSKQTYIYDNMNNMIEIKQYDCSMGLEILEYLVKVDIKYRNNTK